MSRVIHTDTLILGATFYGCGLTRSIPGAVLIESNIAPGADFCFACAPGERWHEPLRHSEAEIFRNLLRERHALTADGRLLTAALAPALAQWCLERDIRPAIGVEILKVTPQTVEALDCGANPVTYHAKRIIDARSGKSGTPYFTAALRSKEELPAGMQGEFFITPSAMPELYYLSWECGSTNWLDTRRRFHELWTNRPYSLRPAGLEVSASRFYYCEYPNPEQALDAGLMQEELEKHIVTESTQSALIQDEYDVIVAGLGTAGTAAAVSAGRTGARVLAIERNTYPGGTFTGGFVSQCYLQNPDGLGAEFIRSASRLKGSMSDTEAMKLVMESAVTGANCKIHYQSIVCGVEKSAGKVNAIFWRDSDGIAHYSRAKTVIDATADAFVCRMAGCQMVHGRASDGAFNCFTNSMGRRYPAGFGVANFDAGRINQYDEENFSRVCMESLTAHLPEDYRQVPLRILLSDLPGIREGERIVPEKPYTLEEFFQTCGVDRTAIFYVSSNLDSHVNDLPLESGLFNDWITAASMWAEKLVIPIPLRTLFPAGETGLIAAGRHIGVDHDTGFALRMIPAMLAVGETAGALAGLSCLRGIQPEEIPFEDLPLHLPEALTPETNRWYMNMSDGEIASGLASEIPGYAIWSAFRQKKTALLKNIFAQAPDKSHQQCHCAMAMALLEDRAAIPVLLNMAAKRDPFRPNGRPHSHARGYTAVYLLGRLGAPEALPLLEAMATHKQEEYEYEYRTHAMTALLKIGEKNLSLRPHIAALLKKTVNNPELDITAPLRGTDRRISEKKVFKNCIEKQTMLWARESR